MLGNIAISEIGDQPSGVTRSAGENVSVSNQNASSSEMTCDD